MRLIDANYLNNKLIRNCSIEEGGIPLKDFHTHEKILELYPTVEAKPVIHGHWIKNKDLTLMCSVCGDIAPYESNYYGDVIGTEKYPYCSYCGAKMDEVEK